jgi:hypothetical protein
MAFDGSRPAVWAPQTQQRPGQGLDHPTGCARSRSQTSKVGESDTNPGSMGTDRPATMRAYSPHVSHRQGEDPKRPRTVPLPQCGHAAFFSRTKTRNAPAKMTAKPIVNQLSMPISLRAAERNRSAAASQPPRGG